MPEGTQDDQEVQADAQAPAETPAAETATDATAETATDATNATAETAEAPVETPRFAFLDEAEHDTQRVNLIKGRYNWQNFRGELHEVDGAPNTKPITFGFDLGTACGGEARVGTMIADADVEELMGFLGYQYALREIDFENLPIIKVSHKPARIFDSGAIAFDHDRAKMVPDFFKDNVVPVTCDALHGVLGERKIVFHHSNWETHEPIAAEDNTFHIWTYSAPAGSNIVKAQQVPANLFEGINTPSSGSECNGYSGEGIPMVSPDGFAFGEFSDDQNNLFIYLNPFANGTASDLDFWQVLLTYVATKMEAGLETIDRMAASIDNYVNMCKGRSEKTAKALREEIHTLSAKIEEASRVIAEESFRLTEKGTMVRALEQANDAHSDTFKLEFEKISTDPFVDRFIVGEDTLIIFTHEIPTLVRSTGAYHNVGKYKIIINLNGQVRYYNLTYPRVQDNPSEGGYHGPHIMSGHDPCWGNVGDSVVKYMGQLQFAGAVSICVRFLTQCNEGDCAGSFIQNYPLFEGPRPGERVLEVGDRFTSEPTPIGGADFSGEDMDTPEPAQVRVFSAF